MKRRVIILTLSTLAVALSLACAVLFVLCGSAEAQQTGKIFRIGFLDNSTAAGSAVLVDAFRQGLSKLGWIEGKNITIEYRFAEQKTERLPELAVDLVRLKVDLIVVLGAPPALAAKKATTTIPIVMTAVGDPVGLGLVASLARPGGNITGNSGLSPELNSKRLEILKDAIPKLSRVGLLLPPWEVRAADDFDQVFAALNKERPDGLYVLGGPLMLANRKRNAALALKSRLPSMYVRREFVDAGVLMSYGADLADSYRRVAYFVDRILKGTKPADLPVEQPTKFELVINLKTVKQIGVTIPPDVLARATTIIR